MWIIFAISIIFLFAGAIIIVPLGRSKTIKDVNAIIGIILFGLGTSLFTLWFYIGTKHSYNSHDNTFKQEIYQKYKDGTLIKSDTIFIIIPKKK